MAREKKRSPRQTGPRREPKPVEMTLQPGVPVRELVPGQRLNIGKLRYFVTIAQELHFGRAARKLGISQPPLSLYIKALERQIGSPLFLRTNRQVTLTAAGRILLNHATQLLDHAQRVGDIMQGVGTGELGEMFIGCVPSAMYDVLPRILAPYRARYPNVHVVLKEGHTMDVMNGVQEGQLDVGLVWRNMAGPSLGIQPILAEKFAALVPINHKLAKRKTLSLDALAKEPLILPPRKISPYHYDHVVAAFAKLGLSPRIEYEVPTILSQIGFVASGFGIAICPSFAKRFMTDQLALIPIAEEMPSVILSLVWNETRSSPVVDMFRNVAREVYDSAGLLPGVA